MKASMFVVSMLLVGFVSCEGNGIENEATGGTEESVRRALSAACGAHEPSSCIALELVGYVDRMLRTAAVQITDDILVVDESNGAAAKVEPEAEVARSASPTDQAQALIVSKLWNFATSRSLRYRLVNDADLVVSGAQQQDGSFGVDVTVKPAADEVESARRRRPYGPLFAAAALKLGLMGALAFKGLTLLVGKALLIGKVALLLASIIGLKKLFSNQD